MGSQIKALDNEQDDLQFLGFFGILKESFKIILTWPKIFIQITLAFILPQYCLFLAYNWISKLIISKIVHNSITLAVDQVGSPTFNNISSSISSEWVMYWLISVVCTILSFIFSLLTISAVVYTVACIYTGKDFTFRKVVSVVPKVWKRLMITFLCNFCIVFIYSFIFALVAIIFFMLSYVPKGGKLGIGMTIIIMLIVAILFMVGLFYMIMIWQLVLEKNCGFKALKKSKELIKGKMGTSFAIILVINLFAMPFVLLVQKLAGFGTIERFCFGFLGVVLLGTLFTLYNLVVQTVFYFVCKSYHHESIDKSSLADHLDEYLGEYVPLKTDRRPPSIA